MPKKVKIPLEISSAYLSYFRLPALSGPNFKVLCPPFLPYVNGSNLA